MPSKVAYGVNQKADCAKRGIENKTSEELLLKAVLPSCRQPEDLKSRGMLNISKNLEEKVLLESFLHSLSKLCVGHGLQIQHLPFYLEYISLNMKFCILIKCSQVCSF